jgi:predicted ATPase
MTDRFLLKSVAIENFKAVRRSGTIKLTPLTVFIGNNGSGKSSLIEALETYRSIVLDGLDAAMDRWHGMEHVWNKRSSHGPRAVAHGLGLPENPLAFRMKGLFRGTLREKTAAFDVRMDISPSLGFNALCIENESIKFPAPGSEYHRDAHGFGVTEHGKAFFLPGQSASPNFWKQLIRRWQFLALNPDRMGEPSPQRRTGGPPMLNRDGSNLGQYLWSLREASIEAFNDLLEALQYVLPYAKDVQPSVTQEIERLVFLEMTEEDFKVPGWLLSTGTLRILALLACLRHPDPPPLLVVEEVENGLDPRALHLLVEEFRAAIAAKKTQILVTTHSPYLLDLLDLSQIVVVERVDGEPVFRRSDKAQLAEWSEIFAPGRLYTMGRLTREP